MGVDVEAAMIRLLPSTFVDSVYNQYPITCSTAAADRDSGAMFHVRVTAAGGPPARAGVLDAYTVSIVCTKYPGGDSPDSDETLAAELADLVHDYIYHARGADLEAVSWDDGGRAMAAACVVDVDCDQPVWFPAPDGTPRYTMSGHLLIQRGDYNG